MTRRVLVVDDEPGFRDMLEYNLRDQDVHVDTVADGRAAEELLKKNPYALVITDISMPQQDGLALLKLIRAKNPLLPVIVMTGFGTVETAVGVMKMGAVDFLLKPFDMQNMVARVREVLRLPAVSAKAVERK